MERNRQIAGIFRQHPDFIVALTTDHLETLNWLRENNLLARSHVCCRLPCVIAMDNQRLDGEEFRCQNRNCRRRFRIRIGSIWDAFRRIPLIVLVRIVFLYFGQNISAKRASRLLNVHGEIINKRTVQKVYKEARARIRAYMNAQVFSGVLRGTIEIDEALFTHRAGPERRGARQIWAIGMVERGSGLAFAFVVPNRNHATINALIRRYILPGSLIIHDGWQGYSRIPNLWRHVVLDHENNITTSQVEGLWGQLRAIIRNINSGGVVKGNVDAF